MTEKRQTSQCYIKASFHSGKLSVDWNGQENFSLSCELWVGTNDFNTKKTCSCPFQSTDNFPEWKLAFIRILQHFATKLQNITNFVILFQAVMKFLSRLV
jgi:hypothetical protein